jgi:hypothetical protein
MQMLTLAKKGIKELNAAQLACLAE